MWLMNEFCRDFLNITLAFSFYEIMRTYRACWIRVNLENRKIKMNHIIQNYRPAKWHFKVLTSSKH